VRGSEGSSEQVQIIRVHGHTQSCHGCGQRNMQARNVRRGRPRRDGCKYSRQDAHRLHGCYAYAVLNARCLQGSHGQHTLPPELQGPRQRSLEAHFVGGAHIPQLHNASQLCPQPWHAVLPAIVVRFLCVSLSPTTTADATLVTGDDPECPRATWFTTTARRAVVEQRESMAMRGCEVGS
jgi:hypothetical protein